ncbi:MAG: LysR family transcriptional regulator [Blautia sp.]
MNLFQLRYFVRLAHECHYTRAAEQLCITQPSLSHAISQLEAELGVKLFEKGSRHIRLTAFGRDFLECVESSLSILDNGVESLRRSAKGEGVIRLGFLRTLGVTFIPELAAAYQREYPERNVQFTFHTDVTQKLLNGLRDRVYDLVFASRPRDEGSFECTAVEKQDLVLIVPRDHPLADRYCVNLEDTLAYSHIFFERDSGLRTVVDGLFEKIGRFPMVAYETDEDQVIAGMVANGFGIAVVPYMELLLRLNVKILQISYPSWERKFYMVTQKGIYLSPAVENFRQFVQERTQV